MRRRASCTSTRRAGAGISLGTSVVPPESWKTARSVGSRSAWIACTIVRADSGAMSAAEVLDAGYCRRPVPGRRSSARSAAWDGRRRIQPRNLTRSNFAPGVAVDQMGDGRGPPADLVDLVSPVLGEGGHRYEPRLQYAVPRDDRVQSVVHLEQHGIARSKPPGRAVPPRPGRSQVSSSA